MVYLQQPVPFEDFAVGAASGAGAASFLALIAGFIVIFLIIGLIVYLYMAFALMTIAKKTNTPKGWLAFIPIANYYLMTQIGKLAAWWTIIALIIPFTIAYLWWKVAEVRNYPGWVGIVTLVPVVNLIVIGLLAWKDK